MNVIASVVVVFCVIGVIFAEHNPYLEALSKRPWQSEQGYVEVRPGAFLFYWLYYADGTEIQAVHKPLIIWIQGGPGLAASGIANFAEIGPLNVNMEPRNHTWVKGRNLLLIDHPVGTGFSYATDKSLYVDNDRDMAMDLSKVIKAFLRKHKEFRKVPTYIFGQSYGGKLCPRLGYYLHTAIQKKRLKMNFKGIGIGSGWVDPLESSMVYPDILYTMGIIQQSTYLEAKIITYEMERCIKNRNFMRASELDFMLASRLEAQSGMAINFNNINQENPYPILDQLSVKVNKYVKPTLSVVNQSFQWSYDNDVVYTKLKGSFFMSSTKFLELLLNKTSLRIAVYNGNLDVITPLVGASNWVHKLRWYGAEEFKNAKRIKILGHKNGFYKTAGGRFSFWGVFGSGHWVPEDNPEAMQKILEYVMLD